MADKLISLENHPKSPVPRPSRTTARSTAPVSPTSLINQIRDQTTRLTRGRNKFLAERNMINKEGPLFNVNEEGIEDDLEDLNEESDLNSTNKNSSPKKSSSPLKQSITESNDKKDSFGPDNMGYKTDKMQASGLIEENQDKNSNKESDANDVIDRVEFKTNRIPIDKLVISLIPPNFGQIVDDYVKLWDDHIEWTKAKLYEIVKIENQNRPKTPKVQRSTVRKQIRTTARSTAPVSVESLINQLRDQTTRLTRGRNKFLAERNMINKEGPLLNVNEEGIEDDLEDPDKESDLNSTNKNSSPKKSSSPLNQSINESNDKKDSFGPDNMGYKTDKMQASGLIEENQDKNSNKESDANDVIDNRESGYLSKQSSSLANNNENGGQNSSRKKVSEQNSINNTNSNQQVSIVEKSVPAFDDMQNKSSNEMKTSLIEKTGAQIQIQINGIHMTTPKRLPINNEKDVQPAKDNTLNKSNAKTIPRLNLNPNSEENTPCTPSIRKLSRPLNYGSASNKITRLPRPTRLVPPLSDVSSLPSQPSASSLKSCSATAQPTTKTIPRLNLNPNSEGRQRCFGESALKQKLEEEKQRKNLEQKFEKEEEAKKKKDQLLKLKTEESELRREEQERKAREEQKIAEEAKNQQEVLKQQEERERKVREEQK